MKGPLHKVCSLYLCWFTQLLTFLEWHGMEQEAMLRSLNVLVKRGKAQVFGSEGQEGVKFF